MIRKLTLAAGFGAGYVLGAKAGHERYQQIVAKARELAGQPAVQEAAATVSATASTVADKAKQTVSSGVDAVNEKVGSTTPPIPPTPPAPTTAPVVGLGAATDVTVR